MPPAPGDPVVLSYRAMRRSVGILALALPLGAALPILICNVVPNSISAFYWLGLRNYLVGSLCAVAMFQFASRGYDPQDVAAGIFSALCAVGVAFFPTAPEHATPHQKLIGSVHYTFATLLFLTLTYFCLFLFRLTDK